MNKNFLQLIIMLLTMALTCDLVLGDEDLTSSSLPRVNVYYAYYPPYSYKDQGQPAGIGVEKTKALLTRLDIPHHFYMMPWSRALKSIETDPNGMLLMYDRLAEREDDFLWLMPLLKAQFWLLARQDFTATDLSIEGFNRAGMKAGCYQNSSYCALLEDIGFSPSAILRYPNSKDDHLTFLIQRGRIDFAIKEEQVYQWEKDSHGGQHPLKKIMPVTSPIESYLVANKNLAPKLKTLLNNK